MLRSIDDSIYFEEYNFQLCLIFLLKKIVFDKKKNIFKNSLEKIILHFLPKQ